MGCGDMLASVSRDKHAHTQLHLAGCVVGGAAALADRWPADSGTNGPEMGLWLLGGAHVEVMHSSLVFANGSRTVLRREGVDGVQGHRGAVGVTAGASGAPG